MTKTELQILKAGGVSTDAPPVLMAQIPKVLYKTQSMKVVFDIS